mgnify:CR=1 FL=1
MRRRKTKKRQGRIETVIGSLFLLVLVLFLVINIIVPDKKKSVQENRMLATRPSFSLSSVMSGDFTEKFENYMTDQFVGRDFWYHVKVTADRIGGVHKENGIYVGKNGQLLEDIEVPEGEHLSENIKAIQSFADENADIPVRMMIAPDAATVLSSSLPALAKVEDQNQMISMVKKALGDSVEWIDVSSALNKHKKEKIYYKTDQHWTALGAFYAFQDAASKLGISGDVSDEYISYIVSDNFNGMLASKSGVNLKEKEQIEIYVPKEEDNDLIVNYVDEGKRTTSLYDSSALETKNQYDVYLGGNSSLLDIKTVSTSTKRLLLVKDSFADCFIPFLTPYYREIVVVDPRYYSGTIQNVMDTYRISEVLFLYSGNTFFKDNNISGVFSGE